ncbi:MAG: hypothetical protein [Microviridae sp.]|nr:MAG: hypothetical protein [Microviridae sp.]
MMYLPSSSSIPRTSRFTALVTLKIIWQRLRQTVPLSRWLQRHRLRRFSGEQTTLGYAASVLGCTQSGDPALNIRPDPRAQEHVLGWVAGPVLRRRGATGGHLQRSGDLICPDGDTHLSLDGQLVPGHAVFRVSDTPTLEQLAEIQRRARQPGGLDELPCSADDFPGRRLCRRVPF